MNKLGKGNNKKRKEEEKPKKKSDLKAFLKKRAPFYLAGITILIVFVIPELTKGDLESSLPELTAEEEQIVDIVIDYNGPNQSGLTVMEAISNKISEEYPDEKIFQHKKTKVDLTVLSIGSEEYQVVLNFTSHKGVMNYDWNINTNSDEITSNNPETKYIINLVDFYD